MSQQMKKWSLLLICLSISLLLSTSLITVAPASATKEQNEPTVESLFWHKDVAQNDFLQREAARVSRSSSADNPKQFATDFLNAVSSELRSAPNTRWEAVRVVQDKGEVRHVTLQQQVQSVPIWGSQLIVHLDETGVTAMNGSYVTTASVNTKPSMSQTAVLKAAKHKLGIESAELTESTLIIYSPALLGAEDGQMTLAYLLELTINGMQGYTLIVDAHSGATLLTIESETGRNRDIRDLQRSTNLPGQPCYTESGTVGNPSADCISAFNFSGDTYAYFFNTHGRDSFNGSGATMIASVRYGTDANAFWNGQQTAFGPGFATKDVVAHEWAHAVTSYSADLIYYGQSGALNESMSDVFGTMVDRDDWLMGEDTPIGAIRSLSNPNAFNDPASINDNLYYCGPQDNGGVHINSGVSNHAAYLMAEGGSLNGVNVSGVGRQPVESIYYRALTTYLTPSSTFAAAASAFTASCADIYGSSDPICTTVADAIQATQMDQPVCSSSGGTPDAYEPDDSQTQANAIAVNGAAQSHNFHIAGDNDWIEFAATANATYVIETSNLGSASDTLLHLVDTNGTELVIDDDGGVGVASRIEWTAPSSGTYYARVRHYSAGQSGNNTSYDIAVTSTGSPGGEADAYEPDDTPAQASSLGTDGNLQTHNFHIGGDVDWVAFSAAGGSTYTIETTNLAGESDTFISLYDTDGSTVLITDDDGGTGLASRIEWTAPASGTYYVQTRHYSSSAFGAATQYDIGIVGGGATSDPFEPDNDATTASSIGTNGVAQTHNFHVAGDIDWVAFSATSGSNYEIETSNLGDNTDTILTLYGTDGSSVILTDDDSGDGYASRIVWMASGSGTYYVAAQHYASSVYGNDTDYDLSITGSGGCGDDGYEPDDSAGDATTISLGVPQTGHTAGCAGDEDWVAFSAVAGNTYILETTNLGGAADTYLTLYDTDGTSTLAQNDDGGNGLASRIEWVAPASGVYYAMIRHYSSEASGSETNYDFQIVGSGTSGSADSYEPDDSAGSAGSITPNGAAQTHNFHVAGDLDYIAFSATNGASYIIETFNLGSLGDTVLALYDTDGSSLLASDDDGGLGLASRIGWTAPANGTFYIAVQHFDSSRGGENTNYDLRLTSTGAGAADSYEPDDSAAAATTIGVNDPAQSHNFHVAGDNDWLAFSANGGTVYTIRTFNLASESDTYLTLYDTDGSTLIEANDDGGEGLASLIQWNAPASGVYYLKVRHYSSSANGTTTGYDIEVTGEVSGGDSYEPDNVVNQAAPISTDGTGQAHNFHVAGDRDWVAFSADANSFYIIETDNLAVNSDTFLTLYASDGVTQILADDDSGGGYASRIEWSSAASGTYYVQVRHYNSSASGADTGYTLSVTDLGCSGDTYEPNNDSATATSINIGDIQDHNFFCAGDEDWLVFSADSGVSYTLTTFDLGNESDTYMNLYDTDGTTLLHSDDDGGNGLASQIEWVAPSTGLYFVQLHHYDPSASGEFTTYSVRITSQTSGSDQYEDDDTPEEARFILPDGTISTHNFYDAGDEDWAYFPLDVPANCSIETFNLEANADTVLDLYDSGLNLLTSNDDGGSEGLASFISTHLNEGLYYVRTYAYGGASGQYGDNTGYDFQLFCDSPPPTANGEVAAAHVVLNATNVEANDIVEAVVYIDQPAQRIKVESSVKASYLELIDIVPLDAAGKVLDTAPISWDTTIGADGTASASYAAKYSWEGASQSVMRLRWRVVDTTLDDKLEIALAISIDDANGQVAQVNQLLILGVGQAVPKIDSVNPRVIYNAQTVTIGVSGSNFQETPKVYLRNTNDNIQLVQVTWINAETLSIVVPNGVKSGTYKLQVVNPSGELTEFNEIVVEEGVPTAIQLDGQGSSTANAFSTILPLLLLAALTVTWWVLRRKSLNRQ